jgi:formamidopyrimidine-DNA glycosylase
VPELIEVERYREAAALACGRVITKVVVLDPKVVSLGGAPLGALAGSRVSAARRHGKLLLIDTESAESGALGPVLGLRFGMTGSLLVDGVPAIERLRYSSPATAERAARLRIEFEGDGALVLHDPRRFGRAMLDPDESALGPEARGIGVTSLRRVLAVSRSPGPPLKARLMDQSRLAGLGNLLVDEILWRAELSPLRPCDALDASEQVRLARTLRSTVEDLTVRGGSHSGDLMEERRPSGHCPLDGAHLRRAEIGGRTTYWCPVHQN